MKAKKSNTNQVKRIIMPCNELCPKCGSEDIHRLFYAKDSKIENKKYDESPCKWTVGGSYSFKADRDFIKHHCRVCQYGWCSKSLPRKKAQRWK